MANDPLPCFDALWFDLSEVRRFPVVGYVNHNGALPSSLPSGYIQYFEWQQRCNHSFGNLVKV